MPTSGLVQHPILTYEVLMEELDFHVDFLKTEKYFLVLFHQEMLLKFLIEVLVPTVTFWSLSAREPQISLSLFLSLPLNFFLS